ncbi:hypothetical protein [Vibrio sp. Hal054]|uniref:hypothetical protein n=1 Tax=Vibrio sp. Hal054 TaxID=3035158 RepID=UPI00301BE451
MKLLPNLVLKTVVAGGVLTLAACSSTPKHITVDESLFMLKNALVSMQVDKDFELDDAGSAYISRYSVRAIVNDKPEDSFSMTSLNTASFSYGKIVSQVDFDIAPDTPLTLNFYINEKREGCFQYVKDVSEYASKDDVFSTNIDVSVGTYCDRDLSKVVGLRVLERAGYNYQQIVY